MKRDWDLLRKQLIDIEEERNPLEEIPEQPKWLDGQAWEEYELKLKDFSTIEARIAGHLEMLIDNGYVQGIEVMRGADGHILYSLSAPRLTMQGHDLLDTMRSSRLWDSIKETAKTKGVELTFDAIKVIGGFLLNKIWPGVNT